MRGTKAVLWDLRARGAIANREDHQAAVWWVVRFLRRDGLQQYLRLVRHGSEQFVLVCDSILIGLVSVSGADELRLHRFAG